MLSKICQRLLISNCNKEQLCDIIKTSHILIIIDKCRRMMEEGKDPFNKTLNFILTNTLNVKILVVSQNKEDINDKIEYKVELQIAELSRIDAARLLISAAGNCKNLQKFKNALELSKEPIFDLISYKPSGIL